MVYLSQELSFQLLLTHSSGIIALGGDLSSLQLAYRVAFFRGLKMANPSRWSLIPVWFYF
jgi:hypothetical protein